MSLHSKSAASRKAEPARDGGLDVALESRAIDRRKLGLLSLVAVIYLIVSGGAYGIEDAVRIAGPRLALLLCIVVPLTLSLPSALMAAELTALMPVEGGFYFWVKEALGEFGGFAEAYLTILYSAVDSTLYPVLFAAYLSFLIPLGADGQIVLAIMMVWVAGALNLAGVRPVGNTSVLLAAILLAPFAAFVIAGLPRLIHWQAPALPLLGANPLAALGGGLTIVIWNFGGWENASVVAAEIRHPARNYPRAIALALPIVALGYILPLAVAVSGSSSVANWRLGWFSHAGAKIGGTLLGSALSIGGAVSAFAVFGAALLWVSRLPYVLARERYLPPSLARLWRTRATPWVSIVGCCLVFSVLIPLGFTSLVVMDVFFYMAALALEMAALLRLRRLRPGRRALFTIGGGRIGLFLCVALPLITWAATFGLAIGQAEGKADFIAAAIAALLSYPAYALCRWAFGGPMAQPATVAGNVDLSARRALGDAN